MALAIGPLAGGLLIELDWRVIFWMNLPVGGVGVAIIGSRRARVDRSRRRHADRLGRPGGALSLGLTAIVLALIQSACLGRRRCRRPGRGSGSLALLAFGAIEHRVADPIVEFALFRNGPYFGASAAAFALVGACWAVMFFQPQYLQDVRGHSAIVSGLLILPMTVPMIFVSPFSGRLIARFGAAPADDRRDGLRRRRPGRC